MASLARMVVTMLMMGGVMYAAVAYNRLWLNVLIALAMPVAGAFYAVRRSKLNMRKLFVPMLSGMLVSTFLLTVYILLLVVDVKTPFSAIAMLPVVGILVGTMVTSNAKALHAYYVGLDNHRQLYDYLIGNGATHRQAVNYFVRRALEANMVPQARYMAYTVLSVSPAFAWALLMGGISVVTASALSVAIAIAAMAASVLSLVVAMLVARRYCFDDYMSLKEDVKRQ